MSTETVMMGCGHAANGHDENGDPVCVICVNLDPGAEQPVAPPNLDGRIARCSCGRVAESATSLAFFEFRGEGSRSATDSCKHCRYAEVAHRRKRELQALGDHHLKLVCDHFEPSGSWEYDSWYCGCRGWD